MNQIMIYGQDIKKEKYNDKTKYINAAQLIDIITEMIIEDKTLKDLRKDLKEEVEK